MAASSTPFLSPPKQKNSCFACKGPIKRNEKVSTVRKSGYSKFKTQAEEWEDIPIPNGVMEHNFTLVAESQRMQKSFRHPPYFI